MQRTKTGNGKVSEAQRLAIVADTLNALRECRGGNWFEDGLSDDAARRELAGSLRVPVAWLVFFLDSHMQDTVTIRDIRDLIEWGNKVGVDVLSDPNIEG